MNMSVPSILWRKTAGEILLSCAASFAFFFVVFLVNQILLFAEDILSRGADLASVARLLFYSLPTIIAIAVPFSVLAGSLMTASRMSADNEIIAAGTLGMKPGELYFPFLLLGLLISVLSFMVNDNFMPSGARNFQKVYAELLRKSATIELRPNSMTKYGERVIVTGDARGSIIDSMLMLDKENPAAVSVLSARDVQLEFEPDGLSALFTMQGILEQRPLPAEGRGAFVVTSADTATLRFSIRNQIESFTGMSPSEMSVAQIRTRIAERQANHDQRKKDLERQQRQAEDALRLAYHAWQAESLSGSVRPPDGNHAQKVGDLVTSLRSIRTRNITDVSLQVYKLEYYKKYSIPAAAFFFTFLALPLGLGSRKAGRAAGFGLALFFCVIYWALLFAGQTMGYRQGFNAMAAVWLPDFVMGAAGVLLWLVRRIRTGHWL